MKGTYKKLPFCTPLGIYKKAPGTWLDIAIFIVSVNVLRNSFTRGKLVSVLKLYGFPILNTESAA